MSPHPTTYDQRRLRAERALAELQPHLSDHQRLGVQCQHAHHLAAVYETPEGLVYHARTGPHSHGSKDFIDTGRHGSPSGDDYVDLLVADTMADDALPAWCDCGPRSLSRADLQRHLDAGQRTVRLV